MDSLADIYYLVATVGILIATVVNVALFRRNRPNRMQGAIEAALAPVYVRMDTADEDRAELRNLQATAGVNTKAAEHEINGRLRDMDEKLDTQSDQLSRIQTSVEHIQEHDQGPTLHHRVTDLAKTVYGVASAVNAQGTQLNMIHTFLLGKAGG